MGRPLETYDYIAIASIVVYAVFLGGSIILCLKHGFTRSSGWLFLVFVALARIIGSSLRLATVNDPTNESLYIGWMTLNGLGLGPLILTLLGLLGRLFDSINRQGQVLVKPVYQRLIEILMVIAIILLIIGGIKSTFSIDNGQPKVDYSALSYAGTVIIIIIMVMLCLEVLLAFRNQGFVYQGEHRILIAVVVCLPFVLVRLVYSCMLVFGGVTSSVWEYFGMLIIMEMVVVLICEVLGFTLAPPVSKEEYQEVQLRG